MSRCIDPNVGVKILSYDLLSDEEKAQMDAHLQGCGACRDLRAQTFGKEGLVDELAHRVFRLSRRQRVEPHAWVLARLRDLGIPLALLVALVTSVAVYLARREPEAVSVRIVRLAVTRGGSIDSTSSDLVPRLDPNPASLIVRPDRAARAYVYELHAGALRRVVPPGDDPPPQLSPEGVQEIGLPPLEAPDTRVLLVLVPREAGGTTADWDAAVFERLGGGRTGGAASKSSAWPRGARPTLRWLL